MTSTSIQSRKKYSWQCEETDGFAHYIINRTSLETGDLDQLFVRRKDLETAKQELLAENPTLTISVEHNLLPTTWMFSPAVTSSGKMYLIKDGVIVGKVKMSSGMSAPNGMYYTVTIEGDDDASRQFLSQDKTTTEFGFPYYAKYQGITGDWFEREEPEAAIYKNTRIVDTLYFDMGIAHASFENVEGYGSLEKTIENSYVFHNLASTPDDRPQWIIDARTRGDVTFIQPKDAPSYLMVKTKEGEIRVNRGDVVHHDPKDGSLSVERKAQNGSDASLP